MLVAHLGLAIFLFGVTGEQFYKKENSNQIKINEVINIGDYSVKLENVKNFKIDIITWDPKIGRVLIKIDSRAT